MSTRKIKGTYNLEKMSPIVAAYADYNGTKKAYCAEHDLNVHTFNYWQRELNEGDRMKTKVVKQQQNEKSSHFIALAPPMPGIKSLSPTYLLHFPDGKRLEMPIDVPSEVLIQLLKIQI